MIVVKVGGSLYDLPDLGERLRGFVASFDTLHPARGGAFPSPTRKRGDEVTLRAQEADPSLARRARKSLPPIPTEQKCLLVPGGGATADVVRAFDRDHRLGPTAAHWLALRACAMNAWFLHGLLPTSQVVEDPRLCPALGVLDPHAFARADEGRPGCLPHVWDATSDSVAARVAEVAGADLVLLKSVDVAGDWEHAAREGHVDPVFPGIVARAGLRVRAVNLRAWGG